MPVNGRGVTCPSPTPTGKSTSASCPSEENPEEWVLCSLGVQDLGEVGPEGLHHLGRPGVRVISVGTSTRWKFEGSRQSRPEMARMNFPRLRSEASMAFRAASSLGARPRATWDRRRRSFGAWMLTWSVAGRPLRATNPPRPTITLGAWSDPEHEPPLKLVEVLAVDGHLQKGGAGGLACAHGERASRWSQKSCRCSSCQAMAWVDCPVACAANRMRRRSMKCQPRRRAA